jgi:hypothetical protein
LMLVEQFVLRIGAAKTDTQLMQKVFHVGRLAGGGDPVAGVGPVNLLRAARADTGRRSFMTSFFSPLRPTQSAGLPWWPRFLPEVGDSRRAIASARPPPPVAVPQGSDSESQRIV